MTARAAVILAAGQGTRMRSPTPKVLHLLAGRTLLDHAIDAAQAMGCEKIVVVVGIHSPAVGENVKKRLGAEAVAIQDPPLGTGHAVQQTVPVLPDDGLVLVLSGDVPLTQVQTLRALVDMCAGDSLALLTVDLPDPSGYGRVLRMGERLEVGMVGINAVALGTELAPIGGVKHSGIGREGSHHGIDDYIEMKYLCIGDIQK